MLKPEGNREDELESVGNALGISVLGYGRRYRAAGKEAAAAPSLEDTAATVRARAAARTEPRGVAVVGIGVSTGGPNALRDLLPALGADFSQPVLVVQHMPPGFTAEFARSLDMICPLSVVEAADGDVVEPGRVYVAQGDRHLAVAERGGVRRLELWDSATVSGHRPSVDVLFDSMASTYRSALACVLMTGMGRDGAKGLGAVRRAGGVTIAQDEESSVVFGMARVAVELGAAEQVLPLDQIAPALIQLAGRGAAAVAP